MILYDRIYSRNQEISNLKELIHSRYLYENNKYLTANPDGTIDNEKPVIPNSQLLDENTEDMLSIISNDLKNCEAIKNISEVSPLYRNTNSLIKLRNKEQEIIKDIIYLESIFVRPEIDITKTEERVHLSKVKRINYKSVTYLAMHSEDWESRRNNDVYPKRLLAENQFIDYEIYENMVAKTLLDSLLKYWIRLRNQKQVVRRSNFKMERFQNYDAELNFNLARRIFGLWSSDLYNSLSIENRLLDQTIEEIKSILMRLSKLKGSPLDKNVFKKIHSNSVLKWTNKFRHHTDYRYIPIIWDLLNRTNSTNDEYKNQVIKVIDNFHSYMLLIIIRILKELNWMSTINDKNDIIKEKQFQLKFLNQSNLELLLSIRSDHNIEIEIMGKKLIFVPLAADYSGLSEENIQNIFKSSNGAIGSDEIRVVVFCFMKDVELNDNRYLRTYNLLYNKFSMEKKIILSSISPLDIFSTERIRSVFLQWYYLILTEDYLVSIKCPPVLKEKIDFISLGFEFSDINTLVIRRPMQEELNSFKKEAEKVQRKLNSMTDKFAREQFRDNVASFVSAIEKSNFNNKLKALFACPTCTKDNSGYIENRASNEFEAKCSNPNCSTVFGVKYCGKCCKHFFLQTNPPF